MEIRMRSAVSRTAKGYSIEATLDMGETREENSLSPNHEEGIVSNYDRLDNAVDDLSAFQIAKLQEHMAALGAAFPREDT